MIAIIIYGPPGSGKGTQAKLLADKLGFFHFDTGAYLRKTLYDFANKNNKEIQLEKKLNETGKLNTTEWVLKITSQRVKELAKLKQSIIFSGSPRTIFETFGDKKNNGLVEILTKIYGKKNIYIFKINISEKETIKRNTHRLVCSICGSPILGLEIRKISCPFCGGKLKHRLDDNKKVILTRLKEYSERTAPIMTKLKKIKYKVIEINGGPMPYKIHERMISFLNG